MYKITCDGEHKATGFDQELAIICAERYERSRQYRVVRVWKDGDLIWASDGDFGSGN